MGFFFDTFPDVSQASKVTLCVQNSKVAAVPEGYKPVPEGYKPVPEGYKRFLKVINWFLKVINIQGQV